MKTLIPLLVLFLISACAGHQTNSSAAQEEWLRLNREFITLYSGASYEQALTNARKGVDLAQGFMPRDNADLATSLNNLGVTYAALGRYEEARGPLERALAMREQVLGRGHAEVATTLGNLGELYVNLNLPSEAEDAFIRALEIRETAFGSENAELADTLSSLGGFTCAGDSSNRASRCCDARWRSGKKSSGHHIPRSPAPSTAWPG